MQWDMDEGPKMDDEDGDPVLLRKGDQILKVAPTYSLMADSTDDYIVSYMTLNETGPELDPDILGCQRF